MCHRDHCACRCVTRAGWHGSSLDESGVAPLMHGSAAMKTYLEDGLAWAVRFVVLATLFCLAPACGSDDSTTNGSPLGESGRGGSAGATGDSDGGDCTCPVMAPAVGSACQGNLQCPYFFVGRLCNCADGVWRCGPGGDGVTTGPSNTCPQGTGGAGGVDGQGGSH